MPDRKMRRPSCTIDVVLLTAVGSQLAVLLCRAPEGREKWVVPWDAQRPQESMEAAALPDSVMLSNASLSGKAGQIDTSLQKKEHSR